MVSAVASPLSCCGNALLSGRLERGARVAAKREGKRRLLHCKTSEARRTTLCPIELSHKGAHQLHFAASLREKSCRGSPLCAMSTQTSDVGTSTARGQFRPAVIVGGGRVGQALEKIGGGRDQLVRRGEKIPAEGDGPIYVCTRNDVLDEVVENIPPARRDDLIFLQNGMLDPWLESKGLAHTTQLLVYFAVEKAGDKPIDGKTDLNPEGLSAVKGKWADDVAARLQSAGLSCKVLSPEEFKKPMLEKLIWISAFMLVGVMHPGAKCGDVEKDYKDEVSSLIMELAALSEREKNVKFDSGLVERLCAYSRSVASYPTTIKEFQWRNGWFHRVSQQYITEGKEDPTPLHNKWLAEASAI